MALVDELETPSASLELLLVRRVCRCPAPVGEPCPLDAAECRRRADLEELEAARQSRERADELVAAAAGPGSKNDAGKAPVRYLGLLRRSLELVARALEHGARAHGEAPGERNFARVPDGRRRFRDALGRHVLADAAGEWLDADPADPGATGVPHLVCAAVDALITVELELEDGATASAPREPYEALRDHFAGVRYQPNEARELERPSKPWASCSKACGFAGLEGNGCPCGGVFSERIEGKIFAEPPA